MIRPPGLDAASRGEWGKMMKVKNFALCAAASFALFAAGQASAATISVVPWVAPNAFGSPSYAGAVANANGALHDGDSSRGDANQPTYYVADADVNRSDVVVTGFASWNGKADPGTVFGPQYASELGPGKTVVTVAVDSGMKYLAGDLYSGGY